MVSGKLERFHDRHGLYLELSKSGGKHWRWKYRLGGKEKRLSFGAWPEVSLEIARDMRDKARAILKSGIDPGHQHRMKRLKDRTMDDAVRRKANIVGRLHEIDIEMIRFAALQAEKQSLVAELTILEKTLKEVS
jgi:hypothetical protein